MHQLQGAVLKKVSKILVVDSELLVNEPKVETHECSSSKDMDILITLLKEKMVVSSTHKQIQLLTLAPQSWTIVQTASMFDVTDYKVRKARILRSKKGILPDPVAKVGKSISKDVEERVITYYQRMSMQDCFLGQRIINL